MVVAPSTDLASSVPQVGTFEVVVIGAGPAGLSLAAALGKRGVSTLCVDPALDKKWPNNYGTWMDELEPLGLGDCATNVWKKVSVFTEKSDEKTLLSRPYVRVDREKLKSRLLKRCEETGCVNVLQACATNVDTSKSFETAISLSMDPSLVGSSGALSENWTAKCRLVVDATGHKLRFVDLEEGRKPGYQAAYGIECDVSDTGYPYSSEEMLLMDFRDDHMQDTKGNSRTSQKEPTFLYVMPLDNGIGRRVFFEETSLVASPPLAFEKLRARLYKRLEYYNVKVENVHDEEFCLIPMGGPKPRTDQRIIAYGGAAAFVHPATGYMIARALTLADSVAQSITEELTSEADLNAISRQVWKRTWNPSMLRQRDFLTFGGEYLQKISLDATRSFFSAFFRLPQEQWAGFLSFKLEQPMERLIFGLGVFARTSNYVRFSLMWDSVLNGGLPFFLSILPLAEEDRRG